MHSSPSRSAADIAAEVLSSRRPVNAAQCPASTHDTEATATTLASLLTPTSGNRVIDAVQRARDSRRLAGELAGVRKEVTSAVADVYRLECLAKVDAVRDRLSHNFMLGKAEHSEKALAAATLLDERLIKLFQRGEDRLMAECAARLTELDEHRQDGRITQTAYETRVMRTIQLYEDLDSRLLARVEISRGTADAMVGRPQTKT